MTSRLFGILMCAAVIASCSQAQGDLSAPAGPTGAQSPAAAGTNAAAGSAAMPAPSMAGERPWKAQLLWTVTSIEWAGVPGQATSTFGDRCSVLSDYVISATFTGEATHAGTMTGTTGHCSQITWGPAGPEGATYSDGRALVTTANGSTIVMRYGHGTTGVDQATGLNWFRDEWSFTGGTGLFSGATGHGIEGGSFADFNALLAGAPVSMWMEGGITYSPSGK